MKKIYLIIALSAFIFGSCDMKEEYEEINSQVVEAAGEWYVLYGDSPGTDMYSIGLTPIITFNTSADDGKEIWLSDEGEFWDYKVKLPVNLSNMTFGSADSVQSVVPGYEIKTIVNNGKIMKDASTHHESGAVADSIYFEIVYEDDPGTTYYVTGFRRTGFMEDEPH